MVKSHAAVRASVGRVSTAIAPRSPSDKPTRTRVRPPCCSAKMKRRDKMKGGKKKHRSKREIPFSLSHMKYYSMNALKYRRFGWQAHFLWFARFLNKFSIFHSFFPSFASLFLLCADGFLRVCFFCFHSFWIARVGRRCNLSMMSRLFSPSIGGRTTQKRGE